MKFVSDTGALITLEKLDKGYELIRKVIDRIVIPSAVFEELTYGYSSPNDYLIKYGIEDFIEIADPDLKISIDGFNDLHGGEQEAIRLSKQLKLPLLIEEKDGRSVAQRVGLEISGIAGQVLKLHRMELISNSDYNELLSKLYQKGRISKVMYQKLLYWSQ